jgi:hypothetical protein
MIKFQLFDSANSYQCHFSEISTFVVSISHYMRAYFNYQALKEGTDFKLPGDAVYLDCTQMQFNGAYIYVKIGCMERETFTSTKLQLHLYTDQHCSQQYQDGQSARKHAIHGYDLGGYRLSSKVSFKPEFYSCLTCAPDEISQTFNKVNSNWYDDDYVSTNGKQANSYSYNDDGGGRRLADVLLEEELNEKDNFIEFRNTEAEQVSFRSRWWTFAYACFIHFSRRRILWLERRITTNSGMNTTTFNKDCCTTIITTMMWVIGICANEFSSTAFGAMKNVVLWTFSERTCGRPQISFSSLSCAPF